MYYWLEVGNEEEDMEMETTGIVGAIFIAPTAGASMQPVTEVRAVPGRGLEGDRYFYGKGSFSRWPGPHREVTLIAEEALREMAESTGVMLLPEQSRRNILTRGIDVNGLLHQTFSIGSVRMKGLRLCQPCKYLARLTDLPDLVPALLNRGGLRARILTEGVISIGDPIVQVTSTSPHST